ncbi:MAG: TrkA-C domain-containing protein [Chloroflexi bacterium OLB15]|nr:MAG: TrkA-C domain-containing protein [Chloroflexi bacterium OLB15]
MVIPPQLILIILIIAALVLMLTNRIRSDLIGMLVLLSLAITGLVTPDEALAGFSNPAIITLIGLFLISQGLEETGVAQRLAEWIKRIGTGSEMKLVFLFMSAGALLSLVMNNIAAGAVLLPVAIQVTQESQVRASKLLIPLAFGTLLGGMATYFTTSHIVISGILISNDLRGLTMLDFLPTGGIIAIAAIFFMALVGRKLLPDRESVGQSASATTLSQALARTYQLNERMWELRVQPTSALINSTLQESEIGDRLGLTVLAIWRNHQAILTPTAAEKLHVNDFLLVMGRQDRVEQLYDRGLVPARNSEARWTNQMIVDLSEVIIPPRSSTIGKTLQDLRFRDKYGLTSVALWREGRSYRTDVGKFKLEVGDALLMVGPPAKIDKLARDPDFFVLKSAHLARPRHPEKIGIAIIITLLALLASIFDILPGAIAMLAGGIAMVLSGCLEMDDAYRSIEWRVLFLIAGFLPLSAAMIHTGIADTLGTFVIHLFSPLGALGFAGGIFLFAMLITQLIGAQIAALLVGPIAIAAAVELGISPQAIGIAAAIGCSSAFLTPIAHPVNVLMMGPGGYKPNDFLRIGIPILIIVFILLIVGMALFWHI